MNNFKRTIEQIFRMALITAMCSNAITAQWLVGSLYGRIVDETGAVIAGAKVTAVDAKGVERSIEANQEGLYAINNLPPGKYSIRAEAPGFALHENPGVEVVAGRRQMFNIKLAVTIENQAVTITERGSLNTDPESNGNAIVLKDESLAMLPDDPEELAAALQALAGPSAGPSGASIYIDGFTGYRMPSKRTIREIRINQNPFSSEYDKLGYGRIEVLTRAGLGNYLGDISFAFNDESLNTRNPFASTRTPFQARIVSGFLTGPLVRNRATMVFFSEYKEIDDNAIVNATILNSNFVPEPLSQGLVVPRREWFISPRVNYQLNPNNKLMFYYSHNRSSVTNAGVGDFSLASRAYGISSSDHLFRMSETSLVSPKALNETRFQFLRSSVSLDSDNSLPAIKVLEAFTGGGAQVGRSLSTANRWEAHNYTSYVHGQHTFRFGGWLRGVHITDVSPSNFGGTYLFAGGLAPRLDSNNQAVRDSNGGLVMINIDSLERYRRTLLFQSQGLSPVEIRELGGGATQFSIAGGNPKASVSRVDLAGFVQDDWKLRPNFTLSLGLRYENQNNISSHLNFAPRVAFAWSPGSAKQPKMVMRGGFGIFYDRFSESLTLQARRFDGVNQQQFIVTDPAILNLFPAAPSAEALKEFEVAQTIRQVADDLRSPYMLVSAIGVERQLPFKTMMSVTYINARALHVLRARNINAPLPESGERPFANAGTIFQGESSGIFNNHQLTITGNTSIGKNFSIFVNYFLTKANSDTDGVATFPADPYDLRGEYGRSALDVRHRLFLGASYNVPWKINIFSLISARSGIPFNITTGRDTNGDLLFAERPAFATDLNRPGVIATPFGAFDTNPLPGQQLIPRNFGTGPGFLSANMEISRSFKLNGLFGGGSSQAASKSLASKTPVKQSGSKSDRNYELRFSLRITNLFNHTNGGTPIGNLTSPLFGLSNTTAGAGYSIGSLPPSTSNQRIEVGIKFGF